MRRLGIWIVALGGLGALALDIDTPLRLIAGLVLGLPSRPWCACSSAPRRAVPLEQLRQQLAGARRRGERPGVRRRGRHVSVLARGVDGDGQPILVRVYGRDA